jgi:tetratricopeptide (TPR) repeat protein
MDGTGYVLQLNGARRDTLWNLFGHKLGIRDLAFDPSGTRLASAGGDGTIRVWNTASGEVVTPTFKAHEAEVRKIAFNLDGNRIASSSRDGKTKVWDSRTGEQLFTDSTSGQAAWLTFTPDSTRLAVAGTDGTVRFYSVSLDNLLALARTHASRSLTEEECRIYLHVKACPTSVVDQIIRGKELARSGRDSGAASSFAAIVSSARLNGDRRAASRYLLTQGDAFALQGNLPAATASFRAAQQLDPNRSIDPERMARRKAADYNVTRSLALRTSGNVDAAKERLRRANSLDPARELLARARTLADSGKVDSALVLFRRARELDPERDRGSEAQLLASRAVSLTRAATDSIATAISIYRTALAVDSAQVSAEQSNSLCWFGTLWGHAERVMDGCERAVALAGPDIAGDVRDSRGLALAVMGRRAEAIRDFEAFIDQSTNHADRLVRQTWVARLQAGKNPFSAEVLEAMRTVDLADGRTGPLVTQYRNAIRLYPEYLTAHFRLAEAYQSQGNNEGVIREYRTIDSLGMTYRPIAASMIVYHGSATNKGLRNQPATFDVHFESMEPVVTGIVLVGEPLYGSGPFNGVWKGDSLVFWSTAATGDTIRWAAQPTLEDLSGKYEILGGVAAGQGGVWKTRLMKGAPIWKMKTASTNATLASAPASASASAPSGSWSGEWSGDGYTYGLDMSLTVTADHAASGSIVWTLKVSPEQADSARIGHSATEYVAGSYDSQNRTLNVSGYGKEDPEAMIGVDRYRLRLAPDGGALSGNSWNRGKWDAQFNATRKPR